MLFLPRVKNKERFEGQQSIPQQEHRQQNENEEKKQTTKCGLDSQSEAIVTMNIKKKKLRP